MPHQPEWTLQILSAVRTRPSREPGRSLQEVGCRWGEQKQPPLPSQRSKMSGRRPRSGREKSVGIQKKKKEKITPGAPKKRNVRNQSRPEFNICRRDALGDDKNSSYVYLVPRYRGDLFLRCVPLRGHVTPASVVTRGRRYRRLGGRYFKVQITGMILSVEFGITTTRQHYVINRK